MTQEIAKSPVDAKAALAQAVDQSTGLDLMTLSTVMVQSGFFPNAESVAQGVVKILAGRELGFPAIASMRHIYVHNGHIGLQATLIANKIRQSGTYDYKILESTDEKCSIEFKRKVDGAWAVEGTASFTMEEAKRAKLVKAGSGWENYPSDMLFARAITRGQRRHCPDVFGQTVYSEEEVREIEATEPKPAGGQTLEERMAEMMPREKQPESGGEANGSQGEPHGGGAILPSDGTAGSTPATATILEPEQPDLPAGQTETVPVQDPPPFTDREQPAKPNKLTFTVGKQVFETNGITRATLMELFKICPRVGKKYGAEKPAEVLKKEFGLEHRTDLTEEQSERYLIRLREMLE